MNRTTHQAHRTRRPSALLAAATGFVAATCVGSRVAARHDLPGRPLRVGVPLSVPAALAVGWGAGVAAPWPMPVTGLAAAVLAWRDPHRPGPAATMAGLGAALLAGTVVEPVTWDRQRAPAATVAIATNVAAGSLMLVAGVVHLRRCAAHPGD